MTIISNSYFLPNCFYHFLLLLEKCKAMVVRSVGCLDGWLVGWYICLSEFPKRAEVVLSCSYRSICLLFSKDPARLYSETFLPRTINLMRHTLIMTTVSLHLWSWRTRR